MSTQGPPAQKKVPIGPAVLGLVFLGFWLVVALATGRDGSGLARWFSVFAISVAAAVGAGALMSVSERHLMPRAPRLHRIISAPSVVVLIVALLGVVAGFAMTVWTFGGLIFPTMFGE
jgi:hypothetical protein